jgi:hypothetical protein
VASPAEAREWLHLRAIDRIDEKPAGNDCNAGPD